MSTRGADFLIDLTSVDQAAIAHIFSANFEGGVSAGDQASEHKDRGEEAGETQDSAEVGEKDAAPIGAGEFVDEGCEIEAA